MNPFSVMKLAPVWLPKLTEPESSEIGHSFLGIKPNGMIGPFILKFFLAL